MHIRTPKQLKQSYGDRRDSLEIFPSHATRASRSPRVCVAFAFAPQKDTNNYAYSAGYDCTTSQNLADFDSKRNTACDIVNIGNQSTPP